MTNYDNYITPFSWRYASPEMRALWSEKTKRILWRQTWSALARAQVEFGLVSLDQAADIEAHVNDINIERALEIKSQIHHDLMAELRTFAEQCTLGGGVLHLGATSMDIEDNADAIRLRRAVDIILVKLGELMGVIADKIENHAHTTVMAFTHLQPAEPTTLGYRIASYAQDLLADWRNLTQIRAQIRGKGFKGAVGTAASYADLLGKDQVANFESQLSQILDLPFFDSPPKHTRAGKITS